jgi:hypothetical protein
MERLMLDYHQLMFVLFVLVYVPLIGWLLHDTWRRQCPPDDGVDRPPPKFTGKGADYGTGIVMYDWSLVYTDPSGERVRISGTSRDEKAARRAAVRRARAHDRLIRKVS